MATERLLTYTLLLFVCLYADGQNVPAPLSQKELCNRYISSVVRIEAGGSSRGTGFLVSADGYILTAAHVIRDENGGYHSAITIKLPDGTSEFASPAVQQTLDNAAEDYAVLKVPNRKDLPHVEMGSIQDVAPGSELSVIGFPFSAKTSDDKQINTKFCLSAAGAAVDLTSVDVSGTDHTPRGDVPQRKTVKVDTIYFQGPSVKGLSGSPVFSRDTGRVVGILSVKLTGIGTSLQGLRDATGKGLGGGVSISGLNPGIAIHEILTVLDDQLANDLGAAVGIDDPKHALNQAQRHGTNRR